MRENHQKHRPNGAAAEGGRPIGAPPKAAPVFLSINVYGYALYIPYIFHIYFLAMFHVFSLVCFFLPVFVWCRAEGLHSKFSRILFNIFIYILQIRFYYYLHISYCVIFQPRLFQKFL